MYFFQIKKPVRPGKYFPLLVLIVLLLAGFIVFTNPQPIAEKGVISYRLDLQQHQLQLYWKDERGQLFSNIGNLKNWLDAKGEKLIFAMNAGMFRPDHAPQGLFIQAQQRLFALDTGTARGNFYLKPNGVFYTTTRNAAFICTTERFSDDTTINYATQSGPMLVIDGQIHPAFQQGSANLNIRNGVGILPNGEVLLAMSKKEINFYDFARYFQQAGCKNALYLDGAVSRMYCPEQNCIQLDGELGVLVGISVHE